MNTLVESEISSTESHLPSPEDGVNFADLFSLSNKHQIAYEALLVPADQLRVTSGACFGEKIQVVEDLVAGDCLRLMYTTSSKPVFLSSAGDQVLVTMTTSVDIGKNQFYGTKVQPIVLMSENGRILRGSVVVESSTLNSFAFLLLPEKMELAVDYTVL